MRIAISVLSILLVTIIILSIVMLSNPLQKPIDELKAEILELTPIGTSMNDVLALINNKGWEIRYAFNDRGVPSSEVDTGGLTYVGEKSIRATIGTYYNPALVYVVVFWAFDENSNLMDIFVAKHGGL